MVPRAPKQKMLSNMIISTRQNLKFFTGRDIFNTQIFAVIGQKETATTKKNVQLTRARVHINYAHTFLTVTHYVLTMLIPILH